MPDRSDFRGFLEKSLGFFTPQRGPSVPGITGILGNFTEPFAQSFINTINTQQEAGNIRHRFSTPIKYLRSDDSRSYDNVSDRNKAKFDHILQGSNKSNFNTAQVSEDQYAYFNISGEEWLQQFRDVGIDPSGTPLEKHITRSQTDTININNFPEDYKNYGGSANKQWERNEQNKKILEEDEEYEFIKTIPAEFDSPQAAGRANEPEWKAFDTAVFSKVTVTPSSEIVGDINLDELFSTVKESMHDYGYSTGSAKDIPAVLAGRMFAGLFTLVDSESYAMGVQAKDDIESTIDSLTMGTIGGAVIGGPMRSTMPALKVMSPYFKTLTKQSWRDLGWLVNHNPSINTKLFDSEHVVKFVSDVKKKAGATEEEAELLINFVANRSTKVHGDPEQAFKDISILTKPDDVGLGVMKDHNTGTYFEYQHLYLPGGNKRYFKREGGEEILAQAIAEGAEDTSVLPAPIFKDNLVELFEILRSEGRDSVSKGELLGNKGILSASGNQKITERTGLKLDDELIELSGIRQWVEDFETKRIPLSELEKRARLDGVHVVAHKGFDRFSHVLEAGGELYENGYRLDTEVTLLGYDFSETLGPRSSYNQSNIDAVYDSLGTGERYRTLNNHYKDPNRSSYSVMDTGGYEFEKNIPLSGQDILSDPNWRSDFKIDEDIFTHIRHSIRAFYNDDGSMGTALTLDELQSDWFQNLNRHNRKDLWKNIVKEDTDLYSFWRSRNEVTKEYIGTFRHTNVTQTTDKINSVPINGTWGVRPEIAFQNDPYTKQSVSASRGFGEGPLQHMRSTQVIGASDEIGSRNIKHQYDTIVNTLNAQGFRQSDEMTAIARASDPSMDAEEEIVFVFNAQELSSQSLRSEKIYRTTTSLDKGTNPINIDDYPEVGDALRKWINLSIPMRSADINKEMSYLHIKLIPATDNTNQFVEINFGFNPALYDEKVMPIAQVINKERKGRVPIQTNLSISDYRNNFKQNINEIIFNGLLGRTKKMVPMDYASDRVEDETFTKIHRMGNPITTLYTREDVELGRTGINIIKTSEGWVATDGYSPIIEARNSKDLAVDEVLRLFNETTPDRPMIPETSPLMKTYTGLALRFMMKKAALNRDPVMLWSSKEIIDERYSGRSPGIPYDNLFGEEISKSILGLLKQNGFRVVGSDGKAIGARGIRKIFTGTKRVQVTPSRPVMTEAERKMMRALNFEDDLDPLPYEIFSKSSDTSIEDALRNFPVSRINELKIAGLEGFIPVFENLNNIPNNAEKVQAVAVDVKNVLVHLEDLASDSSNFPKKEFIEFVDDVPQQQTVNISDDPSIATLLEFNWFSDSEISGKLGHEAYRSSKDNILNVIGLLAREILDPRFADDIALDSGISVRPRRLENPDGTLMGKDFNYVDLDLPIPFQAFDKSNRRLEHPPETLGQILRTTPIRLNQKRDTASQSGKVLGFVDLFSDGKALINFTESADFGTAVHEVAHVFRRTLDEDELERVGRIIMGDSAWDDLPDKNVWTVQSEEAFANAVERYIVTGQYKRGTRSTLDKFIGWIKDLYRAIKGTPSESKMNPKLVEFLDSWVDIGRPTEETLRHAVPAHQLDKALKFYGYSTNVIRTEEIPTTLVSATGAKVSLHEQSQFSQESSRLYKIDDQDFTDIRNNIKNREQAINELTWDEFQKWELENIDQAEVGLPLLPGMQSMEEIADSNFIVDSWEQISRLPIFKQLIRMWNPSAAATDPLFKSLYVYNRMLDQGEQLSTVAMANLLRLGKSRDIFGITDDTGKIAEGPLTGFFLNDIRSNPLDARWRNKLTIEMTQWIRTAESLERAKLAMLKAEGIDIRTLTEDESFVYAGRRLYAKVTEDGEILDVINMGVGSRIGPKQGFEKGRKFETMEEASANGYRYLSEEDALSLNLMGSYKRVAGQRWKDYVVGNVIWTRTAKSSEELVSRRDLASQNLKNVKALLKQLQQTRRGENMHPATLRSLKRNFPQFAGNLDDVSKITLQHLIDAGEKAKGQPISFYPSKQMIEAIFARVVELEAQVEALQKTGQPIPHELSKALSKAKQSLAFKQFARGEAYKNFKAGKGFKYIFYRSARSILMEPNEGLIDELIRVVGGVAPPGSRKKQGGLLQSASQEAADAQLKHTNYMEKNAGATAFEGQTMDVPALSGHIFTEKQPDSLNGITGKELVTLLSKEIVGKTEGYDGLFGQVLKSTTPLNAAFRFFALGGDASPFFIHLIFLWGESTTNPSLMGNIAKGFVSSIFNPQYQHKLLDENRELLAKYPDVIISTGGRTEMTDYVRALHRSGYSRYKPIRIAGKLLQAPYTPFQRGFESMLDSAGIQLLKSLDSLGVDERSIREISDYVNEIRGLSSSKRLGVSAKQRQIETFAALAPNYNRAIAAMTSDIFKPENRMPRPFMPLDPNKNLRTQLARRSFTRGATFLVFMTAALAYSQGEDVEEIAEHFDPNSPKFMTVNVGGTEIGFGSKMRSLIKTTGQIGLAIKEGRFDDLSPYGGMDNPGLRFLRGQTSYVVGNGITALTGETYMGDRIWGEGMGVWDTTKAVGEHMLSPILGPIWAQSALLEGGNVKDRGLRGIAEFGGGRAYPEGSSAILNEFAKDEVNISYEDMTSFERKILRRIIKDKLDPIHKERIARGDKYAMYWEALDRADQDRYMSELEALQNYDKRIGKYGMGNPRQALLDSFYYIQDSYADERNSLNKLYDMFQDDVEYDEEDPQKFVLSEWYGLYDQATNREGFDKTKLDRLQNEFWKRKLPDGTEYSRYFGYIRMETLTTSHPIQYRDILPRETVERYDLSHNARIEYLRGRGNWPQVFDKYGFSDKDLSLWK